MTPTDPMQNVGTQLHQESWLHARAVALLYDELEAGLLLKTEVRVRLNHTGTEPEISGNLLDGADSVRAPSDLSPVGGMVPDLVLHDQRGEPVRTIEVAITNLPDQHKVATLRKRGVDVVIIQIKEAQELKSLCWFSEPDKFAPNFLLAVRRRGYAEDRAKADRQLGADRYVREMMWALTNCSPESRRKFAQLLPGIDSLESFYPALSPTNPKADKLS